MTRGPHDVLIVGAGIAALLFVTFAVEAQLRPPLCYSAANTIELGECLRSEYETADADLNQTYGRLIDKLRASEASQKNQPGDRVRALRAKQREWIKVRDRDCKAEYDKYSGTAAGPSWLACKIFLTRDRTEELAREAAKLESTGIKLERPVQ